MIIKCDRRTQVQVVQGICQDPDCLAPGCWYSRATTPHPKEHLERIGTVQMIASLVCPRGFDEGWERGGEWFAGEDPCQDALDDCPHVCPCRFRRFAAVRGSGAARLSHRTNQEDTNVAAAR